MFAGALRDAIIADKQLCKLLGKYSFDPAGEPTPAVFTADPIPLDDGNASDPQKNDTLPAVRIVEALGVGLDGYRDRSAWESQCDVIVVGRQDHAHEQYRDIAWLIAALFDKNCDVADAAGNFDILGTLAEPPQDLGVDDEGFPQFLVSVSGTIYGKPKE